MRAQLVGLVVIVGLLVPAVASAQEVEPTISTQVVQSFDGTPIVTHLFLPAGASEQAPVPLVLRTHGWGGTGETTVGGTVAALLDAGYAVLTWDQRGFGCSGGTVQIDKPEFEGKDASALIDWAVANAPIMTEGGDPVVGFTGGSYAGGIQTATSAMDPRVDAIAPEISWEDLRYSLYGGQALNQGWAAVLYGAGLATATGQGLSPDCAGFAEYGPQEGGLDQRITQGFTEGAATGTVSEDTLEYFAGSSLASYGQDHPVTVPTLVMQGSVDTLFDLTDGYQVHQHVLAQGAPSRFVVFCGGHVACPASYADADDRAHLDDAILAWFDRYLKGDTSVDTGPTVEYRTNEGQWRPAAGFPPPSFDTATATGEASLVSVPFVDTPAPGELAGYVEGLQGGGIPALPLTTAQPANEAELGAGQAATFEVATAEGGPIELLGIPEVSLTVDGTGEEVVLFAKLVDREAGEAVNLQEGGIRVSLGDGPTTVDVPMPGVAYTLADGHHLDLQVSTASIMHANARTPAQVDVEVQAAVPADGVVGTAPDGGGPATPDPAPGDDGSGGSAPPPAAPSPSPTLPSTGGGGLTALLALGLLAGASALAISGRWWRSARPRS